VIARRAIVTGHVQGVFFRAHVQAAAERHGAAGWAANRHGGSVEIHAEGEAGAVEAVLAAAREGSPRSRVASVDVRDAEPTGMQGFETR
jgi:acylphosphatase